jgi:hypothetical protein
MAARQRTSMTLRSSWSVSTATTMPLPTPFIPSLCLLTVNSCIKVRL